MPDLTTRLLDGAENQQCHGLQPRHRTVRPVIAAVDLQDAPDQRVWQSECCASMADVPRVRQLSPLLWPSIDQSNEGSTA